MGLGPAQSIIGTLRHWRLPAALALLSLLLQLSGPAGDGLFAFAPDAVAGGEVWRLVSGHLHHLGWPHFALNVTALGLIWLLVGAGYSTGQWLLVLAVCMAAIDVGLWVGLPELDWYVGLSGVLHGLFAAGAVAQWQRSRLEAAVLGTLLALKLGYEFTVGPLPGSEETAGGRVITEAHLFGALGGFVAAAMARPWLGGRASD